MIKRFVALATVALALCANGLGPANAQSTPLPVPTPIVVPTLPPADPTTQLIIRAAAGVLSDAIARNRSIAANTTRGTVTYFRRFDMQVQIGNNAYRNVRLHPGTVINPRGATPGTGTAVDVSGRGAADGTLDADTITVLR